MSRTSGLGAKSLTRGLADVAAWFVVAPELRSLRDAAGVTGRAPVLLLPPPGAGAEVIGIVAGVFAQPEPSTSSRAAAVTITRGLIVCLLDRVVVYGLAPIATARRRAPGRRSQARSANRAQACAAWPLLDAESLHAPRAGRRHPADGAPSPAPRGGRPAPPPCDGARAAARRAR